MSVLHRDQNNESEPLHGMPSVGGTEEGAGLDEHHGPGDLLQEAVVREGQTGGRECQKDSIARLLIM